MKIALNMTTPPESCPYLPGEEYSMEFDLVAEMSPADYQERLLQGWRRFGHEVFKPVCQNCQECLSLRIDPRHFTPSRSQKRNKEKNKGRIQLDISEPELNSEVMNLHDAFHESRSQTRDWPVKKKKDWLVYQQAFLDNPIPVEQWNYREGGKLLGVGYVDVLPCGLSAIYFFYDPKVSNLGLGIWNIMQILEETANRGLSHSYLGYYVAGCQSLAYKGTFRPCEIFRTKVGWVPLD